MEFVITFNQPADVIELHEDPVRGPAALEPWKAYMGELVAAGVMRGGNRLAPPWTATTVRVRQGQITMTDGPFAETTEQLGGFYLIEARDLNEAIQVASRIPSARIGSVEVRPVVDFGS